MLGQTGILHIFHQKIPVGRSQPSSASAASYPPQQRRKLYDKIFGLVFLFWDWIAGTPFFPVEREELTFDHAKKGPRQTEFYDPWKCWYQRHIVFYIHPNGIRPEMIRSKCRLHPGITGASCFAAKATPTIGRTISALKAEAVLSQIQKLESR